jgi:chitinase
MELGQYIQIVWKWLWVIVLGTLLAAGVTYGVSSQLPPVDRASASLLPRDPALPSNNGDGTSYFVEAAYPAWRTSVYPPEAIPLDHIQQIGHVFILPGEDGALAIPDGFVMPQLIEFVHAANKKIFVGVGGASSHDEFASMVDDPTDRATFVQNLTDFVIEHGYDGVEIDWEFPQTAVDRENLNALMAELRASLDATGQDLDLNIAVSSGEWFGQWIDVEAITPLVDYYLVMTYSYHGGWSAQSGHNAPLYPPPSGVDDPASVDGSIHYWAETRGVPRSQIVMGLASYGISFNSEDLYRPFTSFEQAYYSEIQPLIGNGYTRHWDSTCQVPYLTQDAGPTLWSYDDPQSIGLKCDYAIENNLGGVAIWDVTGDRINGQQELLEMVAERCISPTALSHRVYLPIIQKQR